MRALLGEEGAVGMVRAFGHHHRAVAVVLDQRIDARKEGRLVEWNLGEQDHDRNAVVRRQPAGRGDPARMAPHHLEHEDLGGGGGHRAHVQRGLERGHRDVLRDRAEARAAVGQRQVVVDGLRHVDGLQRIAERLRQLAHLEAGVGRIAAAVVEEVADAVRLEDLDQALVLAPVLLERLELVAAGAEGARGRGAQRRDRLGRLQAGVDQLFGERAEDAVAAGVDGADAVGVPARRFDHAAGRGVDDRGDAAGLGVEGIEEGHAAFSRRPLAGCQGFSAPAAPSPA